MDSKKLKLLAKLATSALAVSALGVGAQVSAVKGVRSMAQYELDGRDASLLEPWEKDEHAEIPDDEPDLQHADRYVGNLVDSETIPGLQTDNLYLLGAIADNLADALEIKLEHGDGSPLGSLNINIMRRLFLTANKQNDSLEEQLRIKLLEDSKNSVGELGKIKSQYPGRRQITILRHVGRVCKRYEVGIPWQESHGDGWDVLATINE